MSVPTQEGFLSDVRRFIGLVQERIGELEAELTAKTPSDSVINRESALGYEIRKINDNIASLRNLITACNTFLTVTPVNIATFPIYLFRDNRKVKESLGYEEKQVYFTESN